MAENENSYSTLTRKEFLSGVYRDKYGRLRNEKGQFLPEVKNESPEIVTPEDVHQFYTDLWENTEWTAVGNRTFIRTPKPFDWPPEMLIEWICILGVLAVAGVAYKLFTWIF